MSSPYRDELELPIRVRAKLFASPKTLVRCSPPTQRWVDSILALARTVAASSVVLTLSSGMILLSLSSLRTLTRWVAESTQPGMLYASLALAFPILLLVVFCALALYTVLHDVGVEVRRYYELHTWSDGVAEVVAVRSQAGLSDETTSVRHTADVELVIYSVEGGEARIRIDWWTMDAITLGTKFRVLHRPGHPHDVRWPT